MIVRAAENKGSSLLTHRRHMAAPSHRRPDHGANIARRNGRDSGRITLSGLDIWGKATREKVAQMLYNQGSARQLGGFC
jgi:hypothetical protein